VKGRQKPEASRIQDVSALSMRVALNIRAIFGSEVEGLCDGIVAVETAPIQIAISSRFKKSILFHGEFLAF
jgi:hypothetical protein